MMRMLSSYPKILQGSVNQNLKFHIQSHNKDTSVCPLNGVPECYELSFPAVRLFSKIFY